MNTDYRRIKFKMPQFEVKNIHEEDWNEVSEKAVLQSLLDNFNRITPIISEMFQGKEIVTSTAIFRIKMMQYR
jgi:hypothetical protein